MNDDMMPPTKSKQKATKPKKEKSVEVSLDQAVAEEGAEPSEKKPRAERKDYGYDKTAVISVAGTEKSAAYRGQRKEWYDSVVEFDGKTVAEWEASREGATNKKGTIEQPRGWIRFFVQDGCVSLAAAE